MSDVQHISLLRLQQIIRERISDAMPLPCWVTAEISEIKVNYSGHCYMELVEKGGGNAVPKAKASAVIWRNTFGAVASYFRSATGSDLAAGMNVLMKVSVNYHELYGLSLVVSDIDPTYTAGDMLRQRQLTVERLQSEGVFDMNRSLEMPWPARRIAVVSSRNAAGYQDFTRELNSYGYRFELTLFDAFMQGHAAEDSIVEALERVAERVEDFDVVVLIRGGGSQSDLSAFDSYRLASHVAQFPLPVLTGIGHDKDESVADLVAAVSLKTPTAVATWLAEGMSELEAWLDSATQQLDRSAGAAVAAATNRLHNCTLGLSSASQKLGRLLESRLSSLSAELVVRRNSMISTQINRLDRAEEGMRSRLRTILNSETARLDAAERAAESRRPENILSLGFAIVRHEGVAVTDASRLTAGQHLEISFSEGTAKVKVENIKARNYGKE